MSTVLVFDLDDTLYDERSYVESGFRAVAAFGEAQFGWEPDASFRFMIDVLEKEGRGCVFDRWLAAHGKGSKTLVAECVRQYRHHRPRLRLDARAGALLPMLEGYPLYIVTDGHKLVQQLKVEALGLAPFFRHVFITHRYGIARAKPSTYCFERILEREGCDWSSLTYTGDNPAKDFVGLNRKGANTVRVLTGMHKDAVAVEGYEAQHRISHLGEFPDILPMLAGREPRAR
jgi:putative hydrolase of the HAD superfamily